MSINLKITQEGKVKMSMVSERVRLDSVEKFLGRNPDAIMVKLQGPCDPSMVYKPGHVCRIEESDNNDQKYIVFVGSHMIGYLPDEAVSFAEQVDLIPEALVSMVAKVEENTICIYIAE